jgi:hypothetical protein
MPRIVVIGKGSKPPIAGRKRMPNQRPRSRAIAVGIVALLSLAIPLLVSAMKKETKHYASVKHSLQGVLHCLVMEEKIGVRCEKNKVYFAGEVTVVNGTWDRLSPKDHVGCNPVDERSAVCWQLKETRAKPELLFYLTSRTHMRRDRLFRIDRRDRRGAADPANIR